jgi:hypothetical protein
MCKNCSNKSCNCSGSNADGSASYDPAQVLQWIRNHLMTQASPEQVKDAYPKVMIYLEANRIQPTQENIVKHSENLIKAVQDPLFLEKVQREAKPKLSDFEQVKPLLGIAVICLVIITILLKLQ